MRLLKYALPVVVLLGLWLAKTTNLISFSNPQASEKQQAPEEKNIQRSVAAVPMAKTEVTPTSVLVKDEVKKVEPILTSEQIATLKQYQAISKKVFKSAAEQQQKKNILENNQLIKSVQALLLTSGNSEERDLALDLLIEASINGSTEATETVLNIIQDKQIEDEKIPLSERQSLAEVKAELLYNWTAKMPAQVETVNRIIPGPVTAKIWSNAQAMQQQNRTESAFVK